MTATIATIANIQSKDVCLIARDPASTSERILFIDE